jgi:benzoate-CoA ligase
MSSELLNASSIVDRHADQHDKPAFIGSDGVLSYADLRRQVARAGHLLRELGIRREQRILLVLDDTTAFPIVFLGAQRIGAVPVPVSPLDKADNFAHYLDDTLAELVVTDASCLQRVRSGLQRRRPRYLVRGLQDNDVDDLDEGLAAQHDELEPAATHRDDMAFWLYSSGSTGRPKGVVHLHHDIGVTCETYAEQVLGLTRDDVTFSTTKLFHAYGLGNALSFPLWAGATSVLLAGPSRPGPILDSLIQHRPTVFLSVPGLYTALCREPDAERAFDSVRRCISAAEALPPQTLQLFNERFGLQIIDGVGSTEMLHIYCSNRPGEIVPGSTGRAVPGYELRLVDEDGAVLEGPAVGALEVKGDSCAAFYWHQHEKTKHSMLGEWFVSGDRFERREDGVYTYVGRMDDMLKVGGLWVSPIDMEHVLLEHPRVAGVGVVGITVEHASRVAAFVVCEGEPGDDALGEELREWCRARLRRYEYPHVVRFVDALPRTLTGKVQRFRLRELARDLAAAPVAGTAVMGVEP